jgi:hypothetical protein
MLEIIHESLFFITDSYGHNIILRFFFPFGHALALPLLVIPIPTQGALFVGSSSAFSTYYYLYAFVASILAALSSLLIWSWNNTSTVVYIFS